MLGVRGMTYWFSAHVACSRPAFPLEAPQRFKAYPKYKKWTWSEEECGTEPEHPGVTTTGPDNSYFLTF